MIIVWECAPVNSGELSKICERELGWKRSTTYNAIRRMCEKGIVKNVNTVVSVLIPKEQVQLSEGDEFLKRTFNGSLPEFVAAFIKGKKLSYKEASEIKKMIEEAAE